MIPSIGWFMIGFWFGLLAGYLLLVTFSGDDEGEEGGSKDAGEV